MNTTNFDVTVEYNKTTTLNITNDHKKGNLKLNKVDKDNHRIPLGNVEFDLFSEEFQRVIGTYYTDVNGELTIRDLRIGKYKLIEKTTGRWYDLADDTNVDIFWNETTNTTIENELKKGQVKVIKVDLDNQEVRIPGVTFEVLDSANHILEKITTNENGEALTSRYPIRDFENLKLHEIETDKWYVLNDEAQTVELKANEITSVTFTNEKKKGQIKVIKVDLDNNEIRLEGVTFDVLDEKGNIVDTIVTDSNGEAITKRLPIDQIYTLKEKETLNTYVLTTETQTVELKENEITSITFTNEKKKGQVKVVKIDKDNNEILLEGVTFDVLDSMGNIVDTIITNDKGEAISKRLPIDEKYTLREKETLNTYVLTTETQTVELKENEITSITFENEKKKGQIRVIKVDLDNNEVLLEGVTFDILDNKGNIVDTVTTDANGEATSKRLPIDMEYTLKEKETLNEYTLTTETQTVQLQEDEITSITFTNEKKKGQVRVIKVDKDNHEVLLEGVTFDVLDNEGNIVDTIVTDSNGEATSKRLPIDQNYTLRERETLNTYVLTEETQTVELKENEITSITFENEKIKGYVEILKVDSKTKEVLQGAEFGIYNEKDELIETLKTDDTGKATSNLLPYGKYYLKELNTGSIYYLLNQNTYEFEITQNHITIPLTIENDGVDIEVKVDKIGDTEVKPGEIVNYAFMNVANASNVYLDNFKWFDYIPTDYIRLQSMTTGTWNQDLKYAVYYKTNKSEDYILFKDNLTTNENYTLDFTTIKLADDEYITETCFDFGKVDFGFRESTTPTMQCKSLDTLVDGQTFTNRTRTVGIYGGISADADSNWTTIVHTPKEEHEPVLPRTGK